MGNCTECNGSTSGKANSSTEQEFEDNGYNYEPIECQHCGGTGQEPE